ncbi:MAG TPA: MMPL family transporter [Anaeromyxobacteraceae bacterium]|nr:MMPL family transporter [Anaeromyxobacteraceae bacterium]
MPLRRSPLAFVADRYRLFVEKVCARPAAAMLILGLACVPALALTAAYFSDVRAGLQELLPASAPSVRALDQIHARLGGQSHLAVVAQSDDPAANRRFIDELYARIAAAHLPEVRSIQAHANKERKWAEARAPLLMPRDRFDSLMDELDHAIRAAKARANPFDLGLDDEDPDEALRRFERRLDGELKGSDRFASGYLESPDGHTVVMLIWLQGSEVDMGPSERLFAATSREVAAIRPRYPGLLVAYNGEVPNLLEEHAAILADLSLSSLLVFILVSALIALYFRSATSVLTVGLSLLPGLLFTFAAGRLFAGSLNSNTAFLGSIIAGNGINYPLIFLAYYRACDPSWPTARAVLEAARRALPGTLGAAATASAAYGGLGASSFKGFSQFGWLGAFGMLMTWLLSFVCMPIAIALLRPPRQQKAQTTAQRILSRYFELPRAARLVAAAVVALELAGAAAGVARARRIGLWEMDLKALRNRDSLAHGAASWDRKLNDIFGVWLNPVVSLTADAGSTAAAAQELRRALVEGRDPVAERIETLATFVPPLDDQEARLARLRKMGRLRKVGDKLPERFRNLIDLWLAPEQMRPITASEVPPTLRQGLTEVSGREDRVVLIFPSLKIDFDDGRNIIRFADRLGNAHLPEGSVTGGGFLFLAELIRLVANESGFVVLVVCVLVALVLVPIYLGRPRRIAVTVVTVAAVALFAQSLMVALGVRVNMLNFAAVPITIGVGADYVVNLYGAMDAYAIDARRACARMGGAILLCSLTTVVGYLSLVVAQSGALRSFGWAAVLGEAMAVTNVLLVLPAILPARASEGGEGARPA